MSSKQIEPEDFRQMKSDYSAKIEKLEAKLTASAHDKLDIKGLLEKGLNNLLKIDYTYENADVDKKRDIISSMFPEKMRFENNSLRTGRINEVVKYIYMAESDLGGNKKGQNGVDSILSCQVGMRRFELPTSSTPCWRDTGLRYIPIGDCKGSFFKFCCKSFLKRSFLRFLKHA